MTQGGMSGNGLLAAARHYRGLGLHVIPCEPRGKRPLVEWKPYQEEPPHPDEIEAWWAQHPDANVGLVMGRGIFAVDFDGGQEAEVLLERRGVRLPPESPRSRTGKGFHVFLGTDRPVSDRVRLAWDGRQAQVDVRGVGFVVVPPSIHPTGATYTWEIPLTLPLPPAPPELLRLLAGRPEQASEAPLQGGGTDGSPDWVTQALRGVAEGARDQTCTRLAGYFLGKQIPIATVEALLLDTFARRCTPPFPATDVQKCVGSIAGRNGSGAEAQADCGRWTVLDASEHREWPVVRPPWLVHPIVSQGTIGYIAGLPKVGKSLTVLDLLLHETHGRDWLGRFTVAKPAPTVLYIAREDPAWRLRERIAELQEGYAFPPIPAGRLLILSRERFHLTDEAHRDWLRQVVRERGVGLLVLDVLGRMLRGLDMMREGDWAKAQDILEEFNRDLGLTIALLDHARKPPLGRGKAGGASPVELKGPVERYGGADWMIMLAETEQPGRLEVYAESKDSDQHPHFLVEVAPIGAGGPKIRWVADVERLAKGSREQGQANREAVLAIFQRGGQLRSEEVIRRYKEAGGKLGERAIKGHLWKLVSSTPPLLIREGGGKGRTPTYRLPENTVQGGNACLHGGEQALPF